MTHSVRALIIGCGYLGRRVGRRLAASGFRVTATTTNAERKRDLEEDGFDASILDLARPDESDVWRGDYDAVVYAVAPGRGGDARVAFGEGPIACARRLAATSARTPPKFVLVSSTGVYGEAGGAWVDEETPPDPPEERLRWLLGAEEALRQLAAEGRLPAVVLRLGGIYGPGRSPADWLRRPEMRERISRARGDGFMNWVRVEDAAAATVLAIERGRPGEVYVVADGEPVRRADFYGLAARRAGIEVPSFATDGDLGKRLRIDKARRELGFAPEYPSYREGLAQL